MVVLEKTQRAAGFSPRGSTNGETVSLHRDPHTPVPAALIVDLFLKHNDRRNHIQWQMPWE